MPPRRQASSSVGASDEAQQRPAPIIAKLLQDHDFADTFQGETSSKFGRRMTTAICGDADGDGVMVGNGDAAASANGAGNDTMATGLPPPASFDFDAAPVDLNELMLRQLKEDRAALHYDMEWTSHQVGLHDLTPAESRTYQLRLLDLGHQLRQVNHRIHMREAELHNYRHAPQAVYGGQQPIAPHPAQHAFFMGSEPPQERRGPGRPLGSKNRAREPPGPASTPAPQAPTNNAQKAAALASAGAKRSILPSEITVATPDGGKAEPGPLSKRPRVEVGSPLGSPADDDTKMAVDSDPAKDAHSGDTTNDDSVAESRPASRLLLDQFCKATPPSAAKPHASPAPSTPQVPPMPASADSAQLQAGSCTPAGPRTTPGGTVDETGPGGKEYTRLGHWMCTLCTSQKYLQQPAPKQPSEPSSWPLRDVSKIVTHYTRMHGEHNRMERCMELGTALQANLGPFRYWIQETKREKISLEEVREALNTLQRGQLPDLLRRFSTAARAFPN